MVTQLGVSIAGSDHSRCILQTHWLDEHFLGSQRDRAAFSLVSQPGVRNCYLILKQLIPKKGEKKHGR